MPGKNRASGYFLLSFLRAAIHAKGPFNMMKTLISTLTILSLPFAVATAQEKPADPASATTAAADPFLWLEGVTDAKALDWVRTRNAETRKELATSPEFLATKADLLSILNSDDRIPVIEKQGDFYYNFWRDAAHPRGLWRRTTLEEYRKAEPNWETIIDLDAVAAAEHENWVWHGASILRAGGYRHVLVTLSRGGADASVTREYDLQDRRFVADGFSLPEAKGTLDWIDHDNVYVATDFGAGSLTTSGYPRIVKRWHRGTPLAEAKTVYAGQPTDMSVGANFDDTPGYTRHIVHRKPTFFTGETYLLLDDGRLQRVPAPDDAEIRLHREWVFISLRTPWLAGGTTYPAGALLAGRLADLMAGRQEFAAVFTPTPSCALESFHPTLNHVLLNVMEDVSSRILVASPGAKGWTRQPLPGIAPFSQAEAQAVDSRESDAYFLNSSGFLAPSSLALGKIGEGAPEPLKTMPAFFSAAGLTVTQHFAISKDGTRIPYFQIARQDLALDGGAPTLLYGYGGFEVPMLPHYSGGIGRTWLAKGGVYILANIRGGGEYGPAWHQAAIKDKRLRAYEDFAAVAQDLIARKVTSSAHLGAQGGSNGGLLMGNMITLYPQLFGAIVCQVPLLDMKRYSHLLAGASWMAEYGDPEQPDQWAYIRAFSPYHNLAANVNYPPTLFMTSTRDDRVHPGHARKMMAKMQALGANVRYFENIEGGHGGAANNEQTAEMAALYLSFLWQQLQPPRPAAPGPATKGS
jgi:prolyl oligopeptidase